MKHIIIIITESIPGCEVDCKKPFETWGSLTEACRVHGWSYNYLKRMKFPFTYRGLTFIKTDHRTKVIQNPKH